jgi:ribosomal protein S18 acetylase RimI-like enzyme
MEEHLLNQGIHLSVAQHKERILDHFEDSKIILIGKKQIGYLKVIKENLDYEIVQFQIDEFDQGRGIGKAILRQLIDQLSREHCLLKLSVLKGNKAKRLYERTGFIEIGEDEQSIFMQNSFGG